MHTLFDSYSVSEALFNSNLILDMFYFKQGRTAMIIKDTLKQVGISCKYLHCSLF